MEHKLSDGSATVRLDASGAHTVRVNFVHIARTACAHCSEQVTAHALALGFPYCMVLHERCLPFFDFTRTWPHPHLAIGYFSASPAPDSRRLLTDHECATTRSATL